MWRVYNVGCGKRFTTAQVKGLGIPQGPTNLCVVQSFSLPREDSSKFVASFTIFVSGQEDTSESWNEFFD